MKSLINKVFSLVLILGVFITGLVSIPQVANAGVPPYPYIISPNWIREGDSNSNYYCKYTAYPYVTCAYYHQIVK